MFHVAIQFHMSNDYGVLVCRLVPRLFYGVARCSLFTVRLLMVLGMHWCSKNIMETHGYTQMHAFGLHVRMSWDERRAVRWAARGVRRPLD